MAPVYAIIVCLFRVVDNHCRVILCLGLKRRFPRKDSLLRVVADSLSALKRSSKCNKKSQAMPLVTQCVPTAIRLVCTSCCIMCTSTSCGMQLYSGDSLWCRCQFSYKIIKVLWQIVPIFIQSAGFFFRFFFQVGRVKSEIFQWVKSENYPVFHINHTPFYV